MLRGMVNQQHSAPGLHGPVLWLVSLIVGTAVGCGAAFLLPAASATPPAPEIPLWLCIPFALLLGAIALMPFINAKWWHHHYPDVALFLGGTIVGYYLVAFRGFDTGHGAYGNYKMFHAALEYYSFMALIGSLYLCSGGILVHVHGRASPLRNVLLLLAGAIIANVVGTTGASVLLIRPFMRMNHGRLQPIHIVLFIFIVSNCGGSMTPIGDPPLYLGFLKGVPFFWTLQNMWYDWVFTIGSLLAIFYFIDSRIPAAPQPQEAEIGKSFSVRMRGTVGIAGLVLIIAGVFVDPFLAKNFGAKDIPVGATLQAIVGLAAFIFGSKDNRTANAFNLEPIKEVALLFVGIFATMTPALGYLAAHGNSLGISSPTSFYFAAGSLSAFLDNAPTYLNFLQIAVGDQEITPSVVRQLLATDQGRLTVNAISTAAVFFGAMTYIGNGPNFMVKAIAEQSGVKMPSFFGYFGLAICILLPVLVVHWAIFIR